MQDFLHIAKIMYVVRRGLTRSRFPLPSAKSPLPPRSFLHSTRIISTIFQPRLINSPVLRPSSLFTLNSPLTWTRTFATVVSSDKQFSTNPVVDWALFPDFASIRPDHVVPAFEALVAETEQKFAECENKFEPTWEGSLGMVQDLEDTVERAFGVVSHLNMVKDSPDLRNAISIIQPLFVKLSLRMNQSIPKYRALMTLKESLTEWNSLTPEQRRIVEFTLRDMNLSGIGLPDGSPEKSRFNAIQERLSRLSVEFSNNVLDATKSFSILIHDRAELSGCTDDLLRVLAGHAARAGHAATTQEGPWVLTLDTPTLMAFMKTCSNRHLREQLYRANVNRAATTNEPILIEILSLRQEEATILGFENYAQMSLSTKMAQTLTDAERLLEKLFESAIVKGKEEVAELATFAEENLGIHGGLKPWDTMFVSEAYWKHLFRYSEEEVASYFAFPRVINGLFELAEEMFGVKVEQISETEARENGITTWHPDVKVFAVRDIANFKDNEPIAYFYGDFYSRPEEKKGGAWMDVVTTRMKLPNGKVRVPAAYLICNQPPPLDGRSGLMKWRDVETLFHEFGHCLNHMLTTVDYPQASGIKGIEWDFVEVASQFMENFCHEPSWIRRLSAHHETGEPIPNDMLDSLVQYPKFLSGIALLRQIQFSEVDLALHSRFPTSKSQTVFDFDREISARTAVIPRIPEDKLLCSFSHIFGGGYAAGYYSYQWSNVYSADAYAAFIEGDKKEAGRRYRDTVLALGGGTNPREIWRRFRGREEADVGALLRSLGLASNREDIKS